MCTTPLQPRPPSCPLSINKINKTNCTSTNILNVDEATAEKAGVLLGLGGRRGAQRTLVDACNLAADPLVKVRVFIKELNARLKEDSAVEAEHKGWVDAELLRNGSVPNRAEAASLL